MNALCSDWPHLREREREKRGLFNRLERENKATIDTVYSTTCVTIHANYIQFSKSFIIQRNHNGRVDRYTAAIALVS